jgi:hypothetical protein
MVGLANTSSPAIGSSMAVRLRARDNCLNHTWVRAGHRNASGEPYRGMIDNDPAPATCWGGLRKIVRNWKTAMWAGRALVGKAARSLVTQVVKMKIIDLKLPTLATKGCSIGSSIVRTSSGLQLSFRTPRRVYSSQRNGYLAMQARMNSKVASF